MPAVKKVAVVVIIVLAPWVGGLVFGTKLVCFRSLRRTVLSSEKTGMHYFAALGCSAGPLEMASGQHQ